MLVLGRYRHEKLIFDVPAGFSGQIEVGIAGVLGSKVRIGVVAPPEIGVYREEVWERVLLERAADAKAKEVSPPSPGGISPERKSFEGGGE